MKKLLTVLVATSLVLGAAVASASIPDSGGVIHGCYLTSGNPNVRGGLRVIDTDAGESCGSGEASLTWSQEGPAGPQGPSGITQTQVVSLGSSGTIFSEGDRFKALQVLCPTGTFATGGGGEDQNGTTTFFLNDSSPIMNSGAAVGWRVVYGYSGSLPVSFSIGVFAVCTV